MTLQINGLLAIPAEPNLKINKPESSSGYFLSFTGVTQGKLSRQGEVVSHYWNCSMWIPEEELSKWEDFMVPGNIVYVEAATAISESSKDGRFHNTKLKLDHHKTKRLKKPLWVED